MNWFTGRGAVGIGRPARIALDRKPHPIPTTGIRCRPSGGLTIASNLIDELSDSQHQDQASKRASELAIAAAHERKRGGPEVRVEVARASRPQGRIVVR